MKAIGGFTATLLLFLAGHAYCQTLSFRPVDYIADNFTLTFITTVSATYSGFTGDLCANGINNSLASSMCQELSLQYMYSQGLGYYLQNSGFNVPFPSSGYVDVNYPKTIPQNNSFVYANVSCSSGMIESCTADFGLNCNYSGGLLIVKCVISLPECYQAGQAQLINPVNTSIPSGGYYVSGYAAVCSNWHFVPACKSMANTLFGPTERLLLCASATSGSLLGGFIGTPAGVAVSPPTFRVNNTILTSFSCSPYYNCTSSSSMGTCLSGYATATCQKVCDEDQFGLSLYNPQNTVINGSNYTIGVPQFCVTGTISRICNDGTNHPGVAQQVCAALGFAFGEPLPLNSNYTAGLPPQGVLYLSNFTCATDDCEQSPAITSNSQCYAGRLEFIVQCTNGRTCSEAGLFFYNNITTYVNGHETISGIPVNCIGHYAALCNDGTLLQSGLDKLCEFFGFDKFGVLLPLDVSLYGHAPPNSIYYSNFSCDPNAFDTDNCTATPSTNQQCRTGSLDVVLQCSRATNATSSTSSVVASTVTGGVTSKAVSSFVTSIITRTLVSSVTTSTLTPSPVDTPSDSSTSFIVGITVGVLVPLIIGATAIALVLVIGFTVISRRRNKETKLNSLPITLTSVSKDDYVPYMP